MHQLLDQERGNESISLRLCLVKAANLEGLLLIWILDLP